MGDQTNAKCKRRDDRTARITTKRRARRGAKKQSQIEEVQGSRQQARTNPEGCACMGYRSAKADQREGAQQVRAGVGGAHRAIDRAHDTERLATPENKRRPNQYTKQNPQGH